MKKLMKMVIGVCLLAAGASVAQAERVTFR